jgi:hypothetical protein
MQISMGYGRLFSFLFSIGKVGFTFDICGRNWRDELFYTQPGRKIMFSKPLLGTDTKKTKMSWIEYYWKSCIIQGWYNCWYAFKNWATLWETTIRIMLYLFLMIH